MKMQINSQHLNTIKRLMAAGISDEKQIAALTAKEIIDLSKSLAEVKAVVDLQEAIAKNQLLSYLIKKESRIE
jgi:uncharacterized protein YoaH (UPF0181 family)